MSQDVIGSSCRLLFALLVYSKLHLAEAQTTSAATTVPVTTTVTTTGPHTTTATTSIATTAALTSIQTIATNITRNPGEPAGAVVGIVLGVLLGVAFVVIVVGVIVFYRRGFFVRDARRAPLPSRDDLDQSAHAHHPGNAPNGSLGPQPPTPVTLTTPQPQQERQSLENGQAGLVLPERIERQRKQQPPQIHQLHDQRQRHPTTLPDELQRSQQRLENADYNDERDTYVNNGAARGRYLSAQPSDNRRDTLYPPDKQHVNPASIPPTVSPGAEDDDPDYVNVPTGSELHLQRPETIYANAGESNAYTGSSVVDNNTHNRPNRTVAPSNSFKHDYVNVPT